MIPEEQDISPNDYDDHDPYRKQYRFFHCRSIKQKPLVQTRCLPSGSIELRPKHCGQQMGLSCFSELPELFREAGDDLGDASEP